MPDHKRRREERDARGILSNTEQTIARAARALFKGNALAAQRSARVARELMQLDRAVRRQRGEDAEIRERLAEVERSYESARRVLDLREADCAMREERIDAATRKLAADRAVVEQLYATMYAKGSEPDP